MSELKNLIVSEFIENEQTSLSQVDNDLQSMPMTFADRVRTYEALLRKGIAFGIKKGAYLEKACRDQIAQSNRYRHEKLVDETIFDINDTIMHHKNLPKVKYSKKKYRARKGIIQLTLWNAFGFETEF